MSVLRELNGDPMQPPALKNLKEQRTVLAKRHQDLVGQIQMLAKVKSDVESQLQEIDQNIVFETDKAFRALQQQAVDNELARKQARPLEDYAYPHKALRTLVVKSTGTGKRARVGSASRDPLVFDTFAQALAAAKTGDEIQLPAGDHDPCDNDNNDTYILKKSIQIVGVGQGVKISSRGEEQVMEIYGGAEVRFANLTLDGTDAGGEGLVGIQEGAAWLDKCSLIITEANVTVAQGCKVVLTDCVLQGGVGASVLIDPQAKSVFLSDCTIRGAAAGSKEDPDDPWYMPGQAGAIEITGNNCGNQTRDSHDASVALTVQRTTITDCFGHAVTYRLKAFSKRKPFEITWPGTCEVALVENTFKSNGKALPQGSPDTQMPIHNMALEHDDRQNNLMR